MSVVVKMPRTDRSRARSVPHVSRSGSSFTFQFRRSTPVRVLREVSLKYGTFLVTDSNDEQLVNITESAWYRTMSRTMTPGTLLRSLRESCGLTQAALGQKVGVSASRLCDYEAGRRAISKDVAKQLAAEFSVSAERFI